MKREESFLNPLFVIVAYPNTNTNTNTNEKNILRKFSKPEGGFLLISRRIGGTCDISTFHIKKINMFSQS